MSPMNDGGLRIRRLRLISLASFALSLFFLVFFFLCKHNPALAAVSPFAEDPYDAVGSFGVQLSMAAALLSLVPALRPYAKEGDLAGRSLRIVRSCAVSVAAVTVTLTADIVAMTRFPKKWFGSVSGSMLAVLVAALFFLAAAVSAALFRQALASGSLAGWRGWIRAAAVGVAGFAALALYPTPWRQGVPAAILSAAAGMVLLLVLVAVWVKGVFRRPDEPSEDLLDDGLAILKCLWPGFARAMGSVLRSERADRGSWGLRFTRWLNPRRHRFHLAVLFAIGMGIAVALAEVIGEGLPDELRRAAAVTAIFVGLEGAGVLLGYALFARFLGVFRPERADSTE